MIVGVVGARSSVGVAVALLAASPAEACASAEKGEAVTIARADTSGLILLDGRRVRLAGIEPQDAIPVPAGTEATLALSSAAPDRHGEWRGDLYVEGRSLAEDMVSEGEARVRPRPGEDACFESLLAAEDIARQAGLGLWARPGFAVADAEKPEEVARLEWRFAVIAGRVRHVGTSGNTVWIDFGTVWSEDVTLAIAKRDLARFAAAGVAPHALMGQMVRARGVVTLRGGPRIDISEPAAIERLAPPAARPAPSSP